MKRLALYLTVMLLTAQLHAQDFTYNPAGNLEPGSGSGYTSEVVFLPGLRFPLESAPATLNSQVYRPGGMHGGGGGQCAKINYSGKDWRDNFCENRGYSNTLCPTGKGHQGQDIRPATCKRDLHWVVAAASGQVINIGSYSVTVQTPTGILYRYMHMNMSDLSVKLGDKVARGSRLGRVSNDFGGTPTTIHLHFDVKAPISVGNKTIVSYVPPYTSLVDAYMRLIASNP